MTKIKSFFVRFGIWLKSHYKSLLLILLCLFLLFSIIRDFINNDDNNECLADTTYTLPAGTYFFKERVDTTNIPINQEVNIAFDATCSPFFYTESDSTSESYYFVRSMKLLRINETVMFIEFTGSKDSSDTTLLGNVTTYDWSKGWVFELFDPINEQKFSVPVQTYSLTFDESRTYDDVNAINFIKFNLFNDFTPNTSEQWYNDGYYNGYQDGFAQGALESGNNKYSDGYNTGVSDGKSQGYNNGYTVGYNDGVKAQNLTFDKLFYAVIDAPVNIISQFLDFNFLGYNVWDFVRGIIGVFLTVALIKLLGDVIRG